MEAPQGLAQPAPNAGSSAKDSERDERWLLVKRVARSSAFSRSEQMSKLLLYVCRMHIVGRDDEVNEQRIGIDVFRRKPSFDSGSDSIVRSHATRLRQRLELYFSTEGLEEPLRVEIPRGGYVPRFYPAEPVAEPVVETTITDSLPEALMSRREPLQEELSAPVTPPASSLTIWRAVAVPAGIFSILLLAMFLHYNRAAPKTAGIRQSAVETRFWSSLFAGPGRTLVVTGDSGLVLYETFGRQDVSLSDYIAGNFHSSPGASISPELEHDLSARRYTSVADLDLAVRLSHLPEWDDQRAEIVFARDLRAADASRSNLVLIGSRQANPWVSLIDSSMNFVLTPDGSGRYYFANRHPLTGEQQIYRPSQNGSGTSDSSVYALICYRPGGASMGKVLLLSGLWQSGTEAAGNYIMSDPHFAEFLTKIARSDGSVPGFELLVQVHSVAGNAFTSSIVASRVQ